MIIMIMVKISDKLLIGLKEKRPVRLAMRERKRGRKKGEKRIKGCFSTFLDTRWSNEVIKLKTKMFDIQQYYAILKLMSW